MRWSHLTNAHLVPGPGIIKGLGERAGPYNADAARQVSEAAGPRGLLLLAEMSSSGTLCSTRGRDGRGGEGAGPGEGSYAETVAREAARPENAGWVCGFISVRPGLWGADWLEGGDLHPARFVHLTPGVGLREGTDALGQRYLTPETAVRDNGTDILVVGRGVIAADDPVAAAEEYRARGWAAYEASLSS